MQNHLGILQRYDDGRQLGWDWRLGIRRWGLGIGDGLGRALNFGGCGWVMTYEC